MSSRFFWKLRRRFRRSRYGALALDLSRIRMMVGLCFLAWLWLTTRESTLVGNHAWGHECVLACFFSLSLSFTQQSCFLLFLDFMIGAKLLQSIDGEAYKSDGALQSAETEYHVNFHQAYGLYGVHEEHLSLDTDLVHEKLWHKLGEAVDILH